MFRNPKVSCRTCSKIWTYDCPIRVWGRVERNKDKNLDVDPDKDYCSRYERLTI